MAWSGFAVPRVGGAEPRPLAAAVPARSLPARSLLCFLYFSSFRWFPGAIRALLHNGQRRFALLSDPCPALRPFPRRLLPPPLPALISVFLGPGEMKLRSLPPCPLPLLLLSRSVSLPWSGQGEARGTDG